MTTLPVSDWRLLLLLGCALLLSGCATGSYTSDQQIHSSTSRRSVPIKDLRSQPARPRPDTTVTPDSTRPNYARPDEPERTSSNPAVASLLQQAAQARAAGDHARAQTLAERAQGLAPRDSRSYLELSRIYRDRGDHARSRQMALRGLSVADNDPAVRYELQLLSAP